MIQESPADILTGKDVCFTVKKKQLPVALTEAVSFISDSEAVR